MTRTLALYIYISPPIAFIFFHHPSKKSDSASRPSSAARDSLFNATEHVLRQYSPENFIRFPISLKGNSELVDGNNDDVAIIVSLGLRDADVVIDDSDCAEETAAAEAAVAAAAVDGNLRSFPFNSAAVALEAVATPSFGAMPSSLGVEA